MSPKKYQHKYTIKSDKKSICMSEDNKKKLDQTFKATLSNEAHGVYFSLVSLPRAAGVLQNGLKVLLKENITLIP